MPRWSVDPPDDHDFDPPFAEERCDTCGAIFEVEENEPRNDLVECPTCQANRASDERACQSRHARVERTRGAA